MSERMKLKAAVIPMLMFAEYTRKKTIAFTVPVDGPWIFSIDGREYEIESEAQAEKKRKRAVKR